MLIHSLNYYQNCQIFIIMNSKIKLQAKFIVKNKFNLFKANLSMLDLKFLLIISFQMNFILMFEKMEQNHLFIDFMRV
jgi:hypothetical protein